MVWVRCSLVAAPIFFLSRSLWFFLLGAVHASASPRVILVFPVLVRFSRMRSLSALRVSRVCQAELRRPRPCPCQPMGLSSLSTCIAFHSSSRCSACSASSGLSVFAVQVAAGCWRSASFLLANSSSQQVACEVIRKSCCSLSCGWTFFNTVRPPSNKEKPVEQRDAETKERNPRSMMVPTAPAALEVLWTLPWPPPFSPDPRLSACLLFSRDHLKRMPFVLARACLLSNALNNSVFQPRPMALDGSKGGAVLGRDGMTCT